MLVDESTPILWSLWTPGHAHKLPTCGGVRTRGTFGQQSLLRTGNLWLGPREDLSFFGCPWGLGTSGWHTRKLELKTPPGRGPGWKAYSPISWR